MTKRCIRIYTCQKPAFERKAFFAGDPLEWIPQKRSIMPVCSDLSAPRVRTVPAFLPITGRRTQKCKCAAIMFDFHLNIHAQKELFAQMFQVVDVCYGSKFLDLQAVSSFECSFSRSPPLSCRLFIDIICVGLSRSQTGGADAAPRRFCTRCMLVSL